MEPWSGSATRGFVPPGLWVAALREVAIGDVAEGVVGDGAEPSDMDGVCGGLDPSWIMAMEELSCRMRGKHDRESGIDMSLYVEYSQSCMSSKAELKLIDLDVLQEAAECLRSLAHPVRLRMAQRYYQVAETQLVSLMKCIERQFG